VIDIKTIPDALAKLATEGMTPGKIIYHEWLDRELKLDRAAKDYAFKRLSRVSEFRDRLLSEYKVDLKNIRGQGYMIVAAEDQTRLAMDDTIRDIGRAIVKGTSRVQNVDVAKLSDSAKKENTDALARLAGLGSMTKKQIAG
jgi:hypothetical protein